MATRQAPAKTITDPDAEEWRTVIPDNGLTIQQATEETEELAIGEKIKLLLAQSAQEKVYLKLYRVDPKSRILPWCCDYTVEEWAQGDLEMVRVNWGPGQYELRIIGSQGTIGKPRFQIAQPFAMTNPIQAQQPAQQNQSTGELAQVLQSVMQTFMQSQQQILEAIRATQAQPVDSMAELQKMKLIKELFAAPPAPPVAQTNSLATITEFAAAMRAMKDLSGEIAPPQVDADNPMSMIPTLLDTIKSFANKGQQQQLEPHQTMQPMQIPQSIETAPQQPQPNPAEMILKAQHKK